MENKFFLHRIRKDNGTYAVGIEVHDTLDSAIRGFHGQMKMAYNNPNYPNMTFVSCMVTDENDNIVQGYNETWSKERVNDFSLNKGDSLLSSVIWIVTESVPISSKDSNWLFL